MWDKKTWSAFCPQAVVFLDGFIRFRPVVTDGRETMHVAGKRKLKEGDFRGLLCHLQIFSTFIILVL